MEHVVSLEQRAIDFAKRGDFGPDARQVNEELTKVAPQNAGAWTRLARCCLELGQLDDAIAAADAALRLNPQNTIARNLQGEVAKRRAGPAVERSRSRPRAKAAPRERTIRSPRAHVPPVAVGFGRPEFAGLAHLAPAAAVEALGRPLEALLMALNDRPFAGRVVDTRNRAGHAGTWLYRRNTIQSDGSGHVFAHHYGGRWEPQLHVGLFARTRWGRDGLRAGIGFNLASDGSDAEHEAEQERALTYFARFQQLAGSEWRQLLTAWMRSSGGLVQYGADGPAADLLPDQAVSWLVTTDQARQLGWIFCGRWLFADQPEHAAILADGVRVMRWAEETFNDLLPLWTSVYRG